MKLEWLWMIFPSVLLIGILVTPPMPKPKPPVVWRPVDKSYMWIEFTHEPEPLHGCPVKRVCI